MTGREDPKDKLSLSYLVWLLLFNFFSIYIGHAWLHRKMVFPRQVAADMTSFQHPSESMTVRSQMISLPSQHPDSEVLSLCDTAILLSPRFWDYD